MNFYVRLDDFSEENQTFHVPSGGSQHSWAVSTAQNHFLSSSTQFKFFPFVSLKQKPAKNIPNKQTPAQMVATPYKSSSCIRIGNSFSEMKANMLLEVMQIVKPILRIWKIEFELKLHPNLGIHRNVDKPSEGESPRWWWTATVGCQDNWWRCKWRNWPTGPNWTTTNPLHVNSKTNKFPATSIPDTRRMSKWSATSCVQNDRPVTLNHKHRRSESLRQWSMTNADPSLSRTPWKCSPCNWPWQMTHWTNWWPSNRIRLESLLQNSIELQRKCDLLKKSITDLGSSIVDQIQQNFFFLPKSPSITRSFPFCKFCSWTCWISFNSASMRTHLSPSHWQFR